MQQCLPFTVLKLKGCAFLRLLAFLLQQCLPFTVLKHEDECSNDIVIALVATVLTVYGIETSVKTRRRQYRVCCNSAYRLRY